MFWCSISRRIGFGSCVSVIALLAALSPADAGICASTLTACSSDADCEGGCTLIATTCFSDADCSDACAVSATSCVTDGDCTPGECNLTTDSCYHHSDCMTCGSTSDLPCYSSAECGICNTDGSNCPIGSTPCGDPGSTGVCQPGGTCSSAGAICSSENFCQAASCQKGTNVCVLIGACCDPYGNCTQETPADCAAADNDYQGDGAECTPGLCPREIPASSEWGLMGLALIGLTCGAVVFRRKIA